MLNWPIIGLKVPGGGERRKLLRGQECRVGYWVRPGAIGTKTTGKGEDKRRHVMTWAPKSRSTEVGLLLESSSKDIDRVKQ